MYSFLLSIIISFSPVKTPLTAYYNADLESIIISGLEGFENKESDTTVSVYFGELSSNTLQSKVIGTYDTLDKNLVFKPKYGVSYGSSYTVLIKHKNELIKEFLIEIPKESLIPTTYVEKIYPTSFLLPMNQLKIYVEFSASMKEGFSLDQIKLYKLPNRELVKDTFLESLVELWDDKRTRLTIFFDPARIKTGILPNIQKGLPLVKGNTYELVIQKQWLDFNGITLIKDYKKTFHISDIDNQQPNINDWKISFPNNSKKTVEIDFNESMDYGLLQSSFVIINSKGSIIKGKTVIKNNETLWSFSPLKKWKKGNYKIIVNSWLEDLAGNSLRKIFDVLNSNSSSYYLSKDIVIPFNIN